MTASLLQHFACKFPSIFPRAFLEAQIEQLGGDKPELPISAFPFLSCPKTKEEKKKQNKNEQTQDFYMEEDTFGH